MIGALTCWRHGEGEVASPKPHLLKEGGGEVVHCGMRLAQVKLERVHVGTQCSRIMCIELAAQLHHLQQIFSGLSEARLKKILAFIQDSQELKLGCCCERYDPHISRLGSL